MIKDQEDSPETVGAQGGVLGDGVIELHNLQAGGDEPKLKGRINQTNLLDMNDHPKETWCRCASALNPRSCLKEPKLLKRPNQTQELSLGLFTLQKELLPGNLFTQESFLTKSLEVERRNTFPNHRKVTHFKTRCGGGGRSVP